MKTLINFLLILSMAAVSAQKNIDPTEEDVQLAKKLRAQYAKEDVAVLENSNTISFALDKDGKKVTVRHEVREKLMNINHRADIHKYEFYDSESKIENFNIKYRNDKTANFSIEDEFYKDSDLFYNDARVKHMTVDFPVQGYTYNYEMEKRYNDVKYFTSLYFNVEYPVMQKSISIVVPDWLNLEIKEFNFEGNEIEKKTEKNKGSTTFIYRMKNIPPFFKEENAPGRSYLYPHLLLIAKSFANKNASNTLFNSGADLYKWYKSLVDLIKDDPSVYKSKVHDLTANAKTDEEKVRNIYYWVQDNIKYIAFEDGLAGFKPEESDRVFNNRYGDCKGMANLIKQMLRSAGFDARLTWIGTKHISYDYSIPSLAVDNHMICTLLLNGKRYFLDGTEKFIGLGMNAERIQNKEVMIEDGDRFIIDKVPAGTAAQNKETYLSRLTIENELLNGTCSRSYSGESCSEFLYSFNRFEKNRQKDALENYLGQSDKNIQVANVVTSDLNNRDQQLKIDYEVNVKNKVSSFEGEMYIDLDLLKEFSGLDLKDRKTNYEFGYKSNYQSSVVLEIPTGYKVSKLPENLNYSGSDFSVSLTFTQTATELTCKKSFVFKNAVIRSTDFSAWNELYKNLNTIYNQQIVLTKS